MAKVVVVTGASSGFGKQCALALIKQGHIVIGGARRLAEMQSLIDAGGNALALDVSDTDSVHAFVAELTKQHGRVDVLINNAGFGVYDFVETAQLEQMRAMFEVNFWGLVNMSQAVLPHMREQGSGRIINMSSLVGKVSAAVVGFYAASKHAVEAISDATRQEVADFGIDVCVVEPGVFSTGFEDVMFKEFAQLDADSAYGPQLERFRSFFTKAYARAPRPDPVIKAVMHAVQSPQPKTRYVVGVDAKAGTVARKWMSDRVFDKAMLLQMKG